VSPFRLMFEQVVPDMAAEMLAALDPASTRNLVMFQDTVTLEQQRFYLERMKTGLTDMLFVARSIQETRMIGTIGFHEIDPVHMSARLGLLVFQPKDREQGYGTEMVQWGLDWAFSKCGLHRVYLSVWFENAASRILYSRLGFLQEGMRREAYRDADGTFHDMVGMAILASDWRQLVATKKLPSFDQPFRQENRS